MLIKKYTVRTSRLIVLILAMVMIFTFNVNPGGIYAYADEEAPSVAVLEINNVEVLQHGDIQTVYRNAVYKGNPENGENENKWYTTYREINLRDPRIFNISYTVPGDSVGEDADAYLQKVTLKYGGYDLSEWGDTKTLRGENPILILNSKTVTRNEDGTCTVNLALETKSPWPVPARDSTKDATKNIPWDGYYSGRQFDFGVGQSADNRDWWQAGPAKKGCGTYALTAEVDGTAVASTDLHIGPYDEMKSWIEINEYAQSLIKAITGSKIPISELDTKPTGTVAKGYVALDENGNPVEGNRKTSVYVEVSILGYGLTDNYSEENKNFNNYSRFNPIWNVAVALDEDKVDEYLNETKPAMNENPQQLIDRYKDAKDEDIDMLSVYYQNNVHSDEVTGTETMIKLINDLIAGGKAGSEINYKTWQLDDFNLRYRDPAEGSSEGYTHGLKGDYDERFMDESARTRKSIDTREALDKFIFVSTLCSNPDAKAAMRRTNRYAFDLNRDAVFSTMPESIALIKDIMKWDPLVMNEWHGYVQQMLIEPCTAPHDPTYDYDLIQNNSINLAYAAGLAITGNSACTNFLVPWDHFDGGDWDDGGSVYAPMFAELLGTYGFTIEFPYANSDSFDANNAVNYGMIDELLHGKTEFFEGNRLNGKLQDVNGNEYDSHEVDIVYDSMRKSTIISKLTTKLRGINNEDAKEKVDKYFIDKKVVTEGAAPEDRVVGRTRPVDSDGKELSFFPDYIVIPADEENQYNIAEGIKAINQLMDWNIEVDVSTKAVEYNAKTIPKGAYVINMKQAYRNVIFEVMSKGYDATNFSSMYADIYCNLPDVRGFDSIQIYGEELFSGKLKALDAKIEKQANISGAIDEYVIFKSQSTDAVRFVNLLLSGRSSGPSYSEKGDVWMLRKDVAEVGEASDYIIKVKDLNKLTKLKDNSDLGLKGCHIEGKYIGELPEEAVKLVEPVIQLDTLRTSLTGGPIWWMLDDYLGFGSLNNYNGSKTMRTGANVVISNSSRTIDQSIIDAVKEDKPGVILIRPNEKILNETNFGVTTPETVSYVDIAVNGKYNVDDSLFTANYEKTGTYYARGYGYKTVPEGSKILFKTSADPKDAFIGGFQATGGDKTVFADTATIFSTLLCGDEIEGKPVQTLTIGQRLDYRPHYQKLLPIIATGIFAGAAGILDDMNDPVISDLEKDGENLAVKATEPQSNVTESGIEKLSLYLVKNDKEVLIGESSEGEVKFKTSSTQIQKFKAVATDFAGNETEKTFTYNPEGLPDPGSSGGGFVPTPAEKPTIITGDGGKVELNTSGDTAVILPDRGYLIEDVILNGKSLGDVSKVKDLKSGDKLEVKFISKQELYCDDAYKVETLKLTASSSAVKGSITVKWKVKGDKSAARGYQIWRSTKKSSGFKKMFTTKNLKYKNTKALKKGVRYFYKVRAYSRTEEGKLVFSDWSNKAYRIAIK